MQKIGPNAVKMQEMKEIRKFWRQSKIAKNPGLPPKLAKR